MTYTKKTSYIFAICSALIAAANAQTDSQATEGSSGLEEIVVTAQRRSEELEKTPVAVSVITSSAIAERTVVSQADLQIAVPGLTVRETESPDQLNFSLRGQTVQAFSSSTPAVLPYINEVQLDPHAATALFDLESVQVLKGPQGTLFGRNSTGGAVLFTTAQPTDDFGGHIIARAGDYDTQQYEAAINIPVIKDMLLVRLAGFYQSNDGYQYNVANGKRVGGIDEGAGRISVTFKPVDGFSNTLVLAYDESIGTNTNPVLYSALAPFSAEALTAPIPATLLYGPTLDLALKIPGAWNAYLAAHPGVPAEGLYAYEAVQNARGPYVIDINTTPTHNAHSTQVQDKATIDLGQNTQLKNIFGYTSDGTRDIADIDGSPYTAELQANNFFDHQYTDELQLVGKTLDSQLQYVTGVYYSNQFTYTQPPALFAELEPFSPGAPSNVYATQTSQSWAGYAQGTYDLSRATGIEGLSATLGGRYTTESIVTNETPTSQDYDFPGGQNHIAITFKKPSWQIGVQDQLNSNLLLYVVSRHSFRSGGDNASAPPIPESAAQGGALYQPEQATDVEIGTKFQGMVATMPTRVNVAVYNTTITQVQNSLLAAVPDGAGVALASLTVNIPRARVRGVEVEGDISPLSWLNIGTNFTFTDAKYLEPEGAALGITNIYGPYSDTPRWSGSLFAEAKLPLPDSIGNLVLRTDVYSQSLFYFSSLNATTDPGTEIAPYTITNFRVGLEDVGGTKLSLAFIVHNAFDRVYYTGGLGADYLTTINIALPGEPRTIRGEAAYKF